VGDDDQSLYSFKFAHPAGIRTFPQSHAGTTDHEILECRRCPERIVAMANALIANNRDRDPRQLVPVSANGTGELQIVQFATLALEARGISSFIVEQILLSSRDPASSQVLMTYSCAASARPRRYARRSESRSRA
jgi:DNA helicase II / ATP-dependent DNA helicase PcrA